MRAMAHSAAVLFSRLAGKARLRHLQLLAAIGELGNLQRAAGTVGMSQPAATHALAELEALVGAPLFDRHARGMRPTALGAALLPTLRNAMRSLQQCAEIAAAMGSGVSSSLRVGAIGAAISGLLATALPRFSAAHADVLVDVVQLAPEDLVRGVVERTLDLALCREPSPMPDGCEFVPLAVDRYAVVCSPEHPLAGKRVTGIKALAKYHWLMPPQSGLAGSDFARLWEEAELAPPVCWVTSRSPMLMLSMLQQRALLCLVPYNVARQLLDARLLREVQVPWRLELPPLGAVLRSADRLRPCPGSQLLAQLQQDVVAPA
jgi:DNA-binding transcriptional LysR family regulator